MVEQIDNSEKSQLSNEYYYRFNNNIIYENRFVIGKNTKEKGNNKAYIKNDNIDNERKIQKGME